MVSTEDAKRMAAIMLSAVMAPVSKNDADHVIEQMKLLPDLKQVNFYRVLTYLYSLVKNEQRKEKLKN